MKVIIYENRKTDAMVWDASTPEKQAAAFLDLFNMLDEHWQCYSDLEAEEPYYWADSRDEPEVAERRKKSQLYRHQLMRQSYKLAKEGNAIAAEDLLKSRRDYEYEFWSEVEAKDATLDKS